MRRRDAGPDPDPDAAEDHGGGRWKMALLSGGAALGAAALFNAFVRRDVRRLENEIGGSEEWLEWRGHRIFATARGSGAPILLVHGIHAAASSFEWRAVVDPLARQHTVYTVDLLGFGRSDRPDIRYTARLYTSLISDVAQMLVGEACTLIGSALSAAYAAVLGARDPDRFPAVVLIEPTGLVRLNRAPGPGGEFAKLAFDSPVLGTAMFNSLVSRRSVRYWLERAYADHRHVTGELVDHYFQTAHQPGAKYAPSAFLGGHLNLDVRRAMRRLFQPALLVWGDEAVDTPVEDVSGFRALKPDIEEAILEGTGMLPHDEQPEEFVSRVDAFIARSWPVAQRAR